MTNRATITTGVIFAQRGFSVLELLVVISIMTALLALLLPAVQKTREAAQRVECANNLEQIGLATHLYHHSHNAFPAGMRYQNKKDPNLMSSWLAQILPYIEQSSLWQTTQRAYQQSPSPFSNPPHVGLTTVIPAYACPADARAQQVLIAQRENIPVAFTSYLGVEGKDYTTRDGVLFRDSKINMKQITDGTSNTLLAGERPPSADLQYGWWYAGAGQRKTGSLDMVLGVEEINALLITARSCPPGTYAFGPGRTDNQCDMFHFWSLHPGGANFLFADGSVRFLAYSAKPTMPALASRAGNEHVPFLE